MSNLLTPPPPTPNPTPTFTPESSRHAARGTRICGTRLWLWYAAWVCGLHHWFRCYFRFGTSLFFKTMMVCYWWDLVKTMFVQKYLNQCLNSVNWTIRNKLQGNFDEYSSIFVEENMFENVVSASMCLKLGQVWRICTFSLLGGGGSVFCSFSFAMIHILSCIWTMWYRA